jgi:methyl-accepting chemotaxis protein
MSMQRLVAELRFAHKLGAIVVGALAPLSLLAFLFLRDEQASINVARAAQVGLASHGKIESLLEPLADMQLSALGQAMGEPAAGAEWQGARDRVERAMAQRMPLDDGAAGEDARRWAQLQREWIALNTAPPRSTTQINEQYAGLRGQALALNEHVVAASGLVRGPDPLQHYLLTGAARYLPAFEDALGDMVGAATVIVAGGPAARGAAGGYFRAAGLAFEHLNDFGQALEHAARTGARGTAVRGALAPQLADVEKQLAEFDRYVQTRLAAGRDITAFEQVQAQTHDIMDAAGKLHAQMVAVAELQLQSALAAATRMRSAIVLLVLLALGSSVLLACLVSKATTGRLGAARDAMQRLAEGDYTVRVAASGDDELGQMTRALARMQDKVAGVLGDFREGAIEVAVAARAINVSTIDLGRRTAGAVAGLEETAAATAHMTVTVEQNVDNARLARQLVQAAREQAQQGGAVVEQAVGAMRAIDGSSKQIAEILTVIDEIAFQTNLLALNAAVEAARAGDQGRGFAVVASEVRSQAQRSAAAAREIKALIGDSVAQIDEGSRLVGASGLHLAAIVAAVDKVSDVVGEIGSAGQDQALRAQQISRALTQMEQGLQHNAAMVRAAGAATEGLNAQATQLAQRAGAVWPQATVEPDSVATDRAALDAAEPDRPRGVERRGAARPWSKPAVPPGGASAMPPAAYPVEAGSDAD